MPEKETPEQFRKRMQSIGFIHEQTRDKVRTVRHPETGEKAKETTDQNGTVITETPERQDVNIHPETHKLELDIGL